jgi:rhodanese-related sulfurtransferase
MRSQFSTRFGWFALAAIFLMAFGSLSSKASQQDGSKAKTNERNSSSASDSQPLAQVPRITAEEVQRLVKENGNVVFVDTDDPAAYEAEHIKGSVNIAYDPTVDARSQDQLLSALPGDKLIVFYCNCAHEEDSAPMVLEMWELGYDHDKVKALKGGLTRWEQLKYPLAGTDIDSKKEKA